MEYTIPTPNEADPRDSVIEKRGDVYTFTFNDIEREKIRYGKTLKELVGNRDFQAAKMKNIEEHHPFVLEMSEQDMFTAHMYQEAKAVVVVCDPKIAEVEKLLKDYEDEQAELIKQLPELAAPEVAPVVAADAPAEAVPSPIQQDDLNK